MEIRDLYDENKNITGELIKVGDKIPKDRYILVVCIWMQNSKGELLIQQRSLTKNTCPGMWATTGGHPKSGESSVQGIITEVKEELGVNLNENEIELIKTFKEEEAFVDLYYIKKDIDIEKVILQEEEVNNVKWVSIEKLEEMIQNEEFAVIHKDLYESTSVFLKQRR